MTTETKPAAPKRRPPAQPEPEVDVVARAGGHVDRGDGNGWVVEED